jgi:DNA (cytosine-5)-methyltransferase 1
MDKQTKIAQCTPHTSGGDSNDALLNKKITRKAKPTLPGVLEFFAGSGLVAHGMKSYFNAVWANDICEKKAAVYTANHGHKNFHLGSIADVNGSDMPEARLSWASFPCQDLSLAGLTAGIHAERSGLVWQWLRIMDEMKKKPPLLVAENVTGLVSVDGGSHYRILHQALRERGYTIGAVVLNASHWVPQSRPRVFVIAVANEFAIPADLISDVPNWAHSTAMIKAVEGLDDWVWWNLPKPAKRKTVLADLIEWNAPCDADSDAEKKIGMIPPNHLERLNSGELHIVPGYKRTRNSKQVLELRFDGIAGCLRTAEGGSSRQIVVMKQNNQMKTRLLTIREAARLMGAPDSYKLPGSYNDGYTAMGDAVAAPVARYLAQYLLSPLTNFINELGNGELKA